MFSLIIAIVSIALIVALVAVGGYFGGDAVSEAQAKTQAARLVSEERQILASMDMFQADNKRWPVSVDELVTSGYLRSIPTGVKLSTEAVASRFDMSFITSARAAASELGWSMPVASTPVIYTSSQVPKETCKAYNFAERGDNGILRQAFDVLPAQCFGVDGAYRIVVRKPSVSLAGVLPSAVEPGALPSQAMDDWWESIPSGAVKVPTDPDKTPKPELSIAGAVPVNFGQVQLRQVATSSSVTVSNRGKVPAESFAVQPPAGFSLVNSTCGAQLGAGASCSFVISFKPTAAQSFAGLLTATSSNGPAAQANVAGEGVAGSATATPALAFGDLPAGQQLVKDAVLSNTGVGPLQLSGAQVVGTGFAVSPGGTCGTSLAAGASCTIKVALTAAGITAHTGVLSVQTDEASTLSTSLTGQSRQAILGVTPTSDAFGNVVMGQTPTGAVHTLSNTGNLDIPVLALTAPTAPFTLVSNTCTTSLVAGASCSFSVKFTPTEVKSYPATSVSITGTGSLMAKVDISGAGIMGQTLWEYTAAGAYSFVAPVSGKYEVVVVGGGGGGGNGTNCSACWGSGGGSGYAGKNTFSLVAATSYSGVVGAGGNPGQVGVQTNFPGIIAAPGQGGTSRGNGAAGGSGGAAGGISLNGYGPGGTNGSNGAASNYTTGGTGFGLGIYSNIDNTITHGAGGLTASGSTVSSGGGGGGGGGFGTVVTAGFGQDSSVNGPYSNGSIGGMGGVGYGAGGGGGASQNISSSGPFSQGGKGATGYVRIKYVGP